MRIGFESVFQVVAVNEKRNKMVGQFEEFQVVRHRLIGFDQLLAATVVPLHPLELPSPPRFHPMPIRK
jgi:hypothetical protein